ncbi:MAG: hypothetical protein K940chlam1_01246 [Candidatus Anoxychlamydiales bacterium]|nr:hypothetical protein [Candidatus Anoxychlamydiales bacterium]NGX35410.1 hypothetical protein [Candidatus Anoxychlamydiales bacterium]
MRRLLLYIAISLTLSGCFKTPLKTGAISEQNRISLYSLEIGMSTEQVLDVMGYPYKTEERMYNVELYEIWYYITEPTYLGQSELITRNFTPLVFEAGHLIGWGRNFYKYQFDVEDEKAKRKAEKDQKYTDDKEEWPSNQHTIIEPMSASKKDKPKTDQTKSSDLFKLIVPKDEQEKQARKQTEPSLDGKTESEDIKTEPDTKESQAEIEVKKTDAPSVIQKEDIKVTTDQETKEKPSKKKEVKVPCKKESLDEGYYFWE